jgi:pimeloyl-ACP methyl ester carboxylesterase
LTNHTQQCDSDAIGTRTVFYISGYDPRGPSHYHRLYRDEAAKQSRINGCQFDVGPRRNVDGYEASWTVTSGPVRAEYRFLRYDDIMRRRWSRTAPAILHDILRSFFLMLWRGVSRRVLALSWPIFITLVYPFGLLLLTILVSAAAGGIAAAVSNWLVALAAGLASFAALASLHAWLEQRIAAFWLARIISFIAAQGDGSAPDIEARTGIFAQRIAAAMASGSADEVLVVGHSVGTQIAAAAAARALAMTGDRSCRLSLMTLGHTIPLLGLQPGAAQFRSELQALAHEPRLDWTDFSAAIDSACFPLTDPIAGSGLAQADPARSSPQLLSTRFPKLFTPESYAALKGNFKRAHFQYLMAAEIAGDYDYFLITCGDKSLRARFAHLGSIRNFNRFRPKRR